MLLNCPYCGVEHDIRSNLLARCGNCGGSFRVEVPPVQLWDEHLTRYHGDPLDTAKRVALCATHERQFALARCAQCKKPICPRCTIFDGRQPFCEEHGQNLLLKLPRVPWEDRHLNGVFSSWFKTVLMVIFQPAVFFKVMRKEGDSRSALLFGLSCYLFPSLIILANIMSLSGILGNLAMGFLPPTMVLGGYFMFYGIVLGMLLTFTTLNLWWESFTALLGTKMFGVREASLDALTRLTCYASAYIPFGVFVSLIPGPVGNFGLTLSLVFAFLIPIRAYRSAYQLSFFQALVIWGLRVGFAFAIAMIFVFSMAGGILSKMAG